MTRKPTKRKVNARPAAKRVARRRKNPDAISTFAQLAGGIASAMHINEMVQKKRKPKRAATARKRRNPVTKAAMAERMAKVRAARKTNPTAKKTVAAKPNPRKQVRVPAKGDYYLLTIGSGDDTLAVYLQDGDKDGFSKRFRTVAAAKAYATKNRLRLQNPAPINVPVENGWFGRVRARRRAKREYGRELAYQAKVRRTRARRKKAEAAAWNPAGTQAPLPAKTAKTAVAAANPRKPKRPPRRRPRPTTKKAARTPVARKRNAVPKIPRRRTFEMFQGRPATRATPMPVSRLAGVNPNLDQLGDLIELRLASGHVIKTNPKQFKLCARRGRLWIAGGKFHTGRLPAGRKLNPLGHLDYVVYRTHKPHHNDPPRQQYVHAMGEESGKWPTFSIDSEGYPVIGVGSYRLEDRGIVD